MCKAIDDIYHDGMNDGKKLGKAEGKAEALLEVLAMLGDIPERLCSAIRTQTDLQILSQWLRVAVRAGSVKEFEGILEQTPAQQNKSQGICNAG